MKERDTKPLIPHGWLRALLFLLFFVVLFSIVMVISNFTIKKWLPGELNSADAGARMNALWVSVINSTITAFLSVWVFRKWIDKQSVFSLGFEWRGAEAYAATGALSAVAMLGIGTLLLAITGHLSFNGLAINAGFLLNSLLLMALVAVEEELVFRGYLLNNLMQSTNKWIALIVSAVLFAAIHAGNPDAGFLPILEIFVAGLMLGINYLFTRNLWFGIALHFVWNFMQGPILGYKVSGIMLPNLVQQETSGPSWLSGGAFGFEGSVLAMVLNIALIVLLMWFYNRRQTIDVLSTAA